ncbi:uncharacterized protein MKZ38_006750 [Zalerion maritima]|uniref:Amidoligase enzyme n=1 Tax=Zalerion maritima TaxID=339359 RepID=A0AAD5RJR3_9PEZI|nr:uncharacterized protein MKZ38_006750 [Zalerion maritima]
MAHTLRFGLEIELLLKDDSWIKHKNWNSVAAAICQSLGSQRVGAHLTNASMTRSETYQEWAISPELTISVDAVKQKNHYGIELVSPVYRKMKSGWGKQLLAIFAIIEKGFSIANTPTTGTHIHVSSATYFSALDVASIAKAGTYFEPALDCLVPKRRRGNNNYWGQSLLNSLPFANTFGIADVWAIIDDAAATGDVLSVVQTVNLVSKSSPRGLGMGATDDFIHGKMFKWNFAPLVECSDGRGAPLGTVEFRQPSGSTNPGHVAQWAFLAVAFVQAAVSGGLGHYDPGTGKRNRKELWMFVKYGARFLSMDSAEVREFKSWIVDTEPEN